MAKVVMPLMSASASGQIGKSIVFAGWKGTQYVRKYVVPANPMSADQGDQRVFIGGAGRVAGEVTVAGDINQALIALGVIPSGQSKQSYLVKYILDHILTDATAYASLLTEFNAHAHKTEFTSQAAAKGLVDFSLSYASVASFTKGAQLYALAKALIAIGVTSAPFNKTLSTWIDSDVDAMVAAL